MNEAVRYVNVWCAGIGETHVTAVRATEGAELVACSDLDGEIARDFADEHDVESVYTDTCEMIADADVDALRIRFGDDLSAALHEDERATEDDET
jgi:predicted dehydrogenase